MFNLIIDNAHVKDFSKAAKEALAKWSDSADGKNASASEHKQAEAGISAAEALVKGGHIGEEHVFANITGGDQLFAFPAGTGRIVSVRVDSRPAPAPVSVPVQQTVPVAAAAAGATTASLGSGAATNVSAPVPHPYPNEPGFGAIGDLKGSTPSPEDLAALHAQEHPGEAPKKPKTEKAPAPKVTGKSGATKAPVAPVVPVAKPISARAARRAKAK